MVITICNYKGGVGKTTTCHNLSVAKSLDGNKVLMIDLDAQASLTKACGVKLSPEQITIYELLYAESNKIPYTLQDIHDGIIHLDNNVDIISSKKELYNFDYELANFNDSLILKRIIDKIKNDYDYIFIDCSPSKSALNENAMFSCDEILIPVESNFLASEGLYEFLEDIKSLSAKYNKEIKINGIILTMYQKSNLGNTIKNFVSSTIENKNQTKKVHEDCNIKVFNTIIPRSVKVGEANIYGKSVIEYKPKNDVSKSYIEIAKEIKNPNKLVL